MLLNYLINGWKKEVIKMMSRLSILLLLINFKTIQPEWNLYILALNARTESVPESLQKNVISRKVHILPE